MKNKLNFKLKRVQPIHFEKLPEKIGTMQLLSNEMKEERSVTPNESFGQTTMIVHRSQTL